MPSRQQLSDSLQQIGFTPNEAEIYTALVNTSPTFVAPLVKETGKHRQMVYNALDTLMKKDLVARSVRNGKYCYELNSPDQLVQMIKDQETIAHDLATAISTQINQPKETVEVLRGSQSFRDAILKLPSLGHQTREYIIFNTTPNEYVAFTGKMLTAQVKLLRELHKTGVAIKILAFASVADQYHSPSFWPLVDDPYEARVSTATPEPPQTVWISGDHVFLRNHLEDPILIHIISANLAQCYREYFQGYWDQAQPVHRLNENPDTKKAPPSSENET